MDVQIHKQTSTQKQLKTLVFIRWLYILGQSISIVIAFAWFDYQISLIALTPLILIEVIFNLSTHLKAKQNYGMSSQFIWFQLIFDLSCIGLLLYFTGGATNAFISLLLLPVTLAALLCDQLRAWLTAGIAISIYSLLMFFYLPLQEHQHSAHGPNQLHFVGMWITFSLSAVVLVYFINYLSNTLSEQLLIISSLKEQQVRDENLVTLANQSANAAHQLSTPINTIQLLFEELEDCLDNQTESIFSINQGVKEQLNKCRKILVNIRQSAELASADDFLSLQELVSKLRDQWLLQNPDHTLKIETDETVNLSQESKLFHSTVSSALINLIDNAARENRKFAETSTTLTVSCSDNEMCVSIFNRHDKAELMIPEKLGVEMIESKNGLGIGYYLANATIERLGGKVDLVVKKDTTETRIRLTLSQPAV
ncbi:MAG: HAMP domain-containing histidine kinase [Gammaproteobacteria bacterium]|nr:HAMP domain-containing histidine kinase [Gammaproteobacteria bacterium]